MVLVRKEVGSKVYVYNVSHGRWYYLGKEKPIEEWVGKIHCGDAYQLLPLMPSESIDCVITSPPYYGLRIYDNVETIFDGDPSCEHEWHKTSLKTDHKPTGKQETVRGTIDRQKYNYEITSNVCIKCGAWKGQLGIEPSWKMYVQHLVELFREVKRVLKKTGSFWLNIGDTYFGGGHGGNTLYKTPSGELVKSVKQGKSSNYVPTMQWRDDVYKPKCLMGIPWRIAFALIEDGWILRNAVIWFKPNAQPSSVKDRLTHTYEFLFHFVKSKKYYYNLDNIREPHKIGELASVFSKGLEKVYEKMKEVNATYDSKYSKTQYGQTPQSFQREDKLAKMRQASREVAREHFPNDEELQQDFINWVHDHACHVRGKNPGDVMLTKHDLAVGRIGSFSYTDPLHVKAYHPLGKNPGDTLFITSNSKFLKSDVKTASPGARALRSIMSGKLTTHVRKKLLDVGAYLKTKLKESGLTVKDLAELTGIKQTTLEHYFRTDFSGQALPDRETWNLLKPILKLGEYDDYINEEVRSALPQPHPLGRNPSDFWSIPTKPFRGAHFAVFPPELPLRPILASCPPDGVVLDPLAGSGTVAYTCELINHGMWDEFRIHVNEIARKTKWSLKWILIEINPEYCKLAEERLKPFTNTIDRYIE
jgi:DNA modification methylase